MKTFISLSTVVVVVSLFQTAVYNLGFKHGVIESELRESNPNRYTVVIQNTWIEGATVKHLLDHFRKTDRILIKDSSMFFPETPIKGKK